MKSDASLFIHMCKLASITYRSLWYKNYQTLLWVLLCFDRLCFDWVCYTPPSPRLPRISRFSFTKTSSLFTLRYIRNWFLVKHYWISVEKTLNIVVRNTLNNVAIFCYLLNILWMANLISSLQREKKCLHIIFIIKLFFPLISQWK